MAPTTTTETAAMLTCEDGSQFASISWIVAGVTYSAETLQDVWSILITCTVSAGNDLDLTQQCITRYEDEFTRITNQACTDCVLMFIGGHSQEHAKCMYDTCLPDPTIDQCTSCVADLTSQLMTYCNIADSQTSSTIPIAGMTSAFMLVAAIALIPVI